MYLEITRIPGYSWSAGRICGDGRWGYTIYGEPNLNNLIKKIEEMGHKYQLPAWITDADFED